MITDLMAYANENAVPIRDDIYWIGGDDRTASIFEGAFPIPEGVSYNSYLIVDGKTCLLDSCDASIAAKFWRNLRTALDGRSLDYFIVNHMEPDHGACITQVLETWPDVTVVGNSKTFDMMENFYHIQPKNKLEVKEGDELVIGRHVLRFVFAVMVHWPEVMFTYDATERILLVDMICPLHGPIWRKDLGYIMGKYDLWSRYEPEEKGVVIAYTSMYGNTASVADRLALLLKERGVANVTMYDVTRMHPSYVVSDAFRFTNIVLAAPTYNNALHPTMSAVIEDMENMAVQNRRYSLIGNGSWAPQSPRIMEERMSKLKDMTKVGETFVVKSSMRDDQLPELEKLADEIAASIQ